MPRPLDQTQLRENAAFLRTLRRTGNARLSAREAGVAYGTFQHRRARHPDFAQRWDAAVATAQARLAAGDGTTSPERATAGDPLRTAGGEPVVVRGRGGRLQIRRAHPGKLTRACEQAFLGALSATANITLSAAAAGASFAAFDRRRRTDPAFAREMRWALRMGYERVEAALLEGWSPANPEAAAWRDNDPPPVPAMTANQALQLLYLHQKAVVFHDERPDLRRRRGEPHAVHTARLAAQYIARLAQEAEDSRLATVLRNAATARAPSYPPDPPILPALDQVTGWSRADPTKPPTDPTRALFGGWRIEDMKGKG